ncbi:ABC transporter ATP-binding protein, partial [Nocardioides albidus]
MTRLPPPRSGRVLLDGKELHSLPAKQPARRLGLLPQSPIAPEGITVGDLVDHAVDELSGGQRQRVRIAMALAQESEIPLLDEPTTFLDVSHQVEVLDLLTDLNRAKGTTIVMVLHDLNLAARYADHLVALHDGRRYAAGHPRDVLSPGLVQDVFGLPCTVIDDPVSGKPLMIPVGRHHVQLSEVAGR